ncbi:ATP-binding cassette domain-containing protein [Microbacterium sp.]|uniref:ATP-binding cassette domain-containing protein n=1 Tax=Microbacterium sp. TaxID=51671 RepID=UPI0025FCE034|nr:ATP-binding cassette domain-containing protein [Microbacterium sp.]
MTRAGRLRLRPGPLRAAAGLAAIFVVARVVYRVLFHGADGSGVVLLPLPAVRLPAPFSWVTLLGPVTIDGLWGAVLSALPIAAVILLFGLLNALFDISRAFGLLARRGPLRGIARALAVAWSTLPGLGQAVRTVHTAQRLRGEKAGPRMLVPVLERTLERAAAVANGLELRGFGGAPVDGECLTPVTVRDAAFGFGDAPVLSVPQLSLGTGVLAVATGPTGSGKSTMLRGLAGLVDHVDGGWSTGVVEVAGHARRRTPPRDSSRLVGVVLQNPREGFCSELVRDEIGLSLQLRGVASTIVTARVDEVAERLGIAHLRDRAVHALSAGEATMVAIAAAVVERPILLLVDEPLADLDADARARVVAALESLAHEGGVCVLVAEHRAAAFEDVADEWWTIEAGALSEQSETKRLSRPALPPLDSHRVSAPSLRSLAQRTEVASPSALAASHVRIALDDTIAVADATLSLARGEIAAVIGPNGAGKSSLLMALALPPRDLVVTGRPVLVPDASDDLFTRDTVAAECARADRRARRAGISSQTATAERFAAFLDLDTGGLRGRMTRHPLDLSLGERRCLAIALQLARAPEALLIDEPTRGLDVRARDQVREALSGAADAGTAVLVATHDVDFAHSIGARILPMSDGVVPAAVTDEPHRSVDHLPHIDLPSPVERATDSTSVRAQSADVPEDSRVSSRFARSTNGGEEAASRSARSTNGSEGASPRSTNGWHGGRLALLAANLVALAAFTWPFVAVAVPSQATAAVPWVALALAPVAVIVAIAALDQTVRSAHTLAYLGVLAAIGTALRIASTGVGGVEAVFILLVLAGRAFGARFGMLLGVATILLSSTVFGGFGPWTPFQMFACAWVGGGAGLLPRRVRGWGEIIMLCAYGAIASYLFGLLLNLWFWPFAIGSGTTISYAPGAPLVENLGSFLLYSLVTSTAGWDTLRAITTIAGVVLIGRPVLAALRRAKPVALRAPAPPSTRDVSDS